MDFSEYLSNKQIIIIIIIYYYFFKIRENFIEHINYSATMILKVLILPLNRKCILTANIFESGPMPTPSLVPPKGI